MIFCSTCGWLMRGTMWGKQGFACRDSGQIEIHRACGQKPIKAFTLEKQVIKLLRNATKVWEKSVSP